MPAPAPSTNRNPWPWAIIAFFVLFMTWTVGFIIFSAFHRVDLVSPDYYADTGRFQEQMESRKRAEQLSPPATIVYQPEHQSLRITLPPAHAAQHPEGSIRLYRPAAAGLDRQLELRVNGAGTQTVAANGLAAGLWKVRLQWTVNRQDFCQDQAVIIPEGISP